MNYKNPKSVTKRILKKRIIEVVFKQCTEKLCSDSREIQEIEANIERILVDFSERTCLEVKALRLTQEGDNKYRLTMEVK